MEARINIRTHKRFKLTMRDIETAIAARDYRAKELLKSQDYQQVREGLESMKDMLYCDDSGGHLFYVALGYARLGSYREALRCAERCIRLDISRDDAKELRAWILDRQANGIGREPPQVKPDWADYLSPISCAATSNEQSTGSRSAGLEISSSNDDCKKLSRQIARVYKSKSQTPEFYRRKMSLKDRLETVLRRKFGISLCLHAFGSTENKMGTKDSDLDLYLQLSNDRREPTAILEAVEDILEKSCEISGLSQVIPASVPILRFRSRENIAVDLNVTSPIAVKSTYLLRCYAQLDKRVAPLVVFVKLWAEKCQIREPMQLLGSYAYSLMVIHYLQFECSPPVLPNLFTTMDKVFSPDCRDLGTFKMKQTLPQFVSSNEDSLGKLLLGFFYYYSQEFDFKRHRISIKYADREDRWFSIDEEMISIEDPFRPGFNVARSVSDQINRSKIKDAFSNSYKKLSQSKDLNSVYYITTDY